MLTAEQLEKLNAGEAVSIATIQKGSMIGQTEKGDVVVVQPDAHPLFISGPNVVTGKMVNGSPTFSFFEVNVAATFSVGVASELD